MKQSTVTHTASSNLQVYQRKKFSLVCFIDFFASTEIKVQSMAQICLKQDTGIYNLAKLETALF